MFNTWCTVLGLSDRTPVPCSDNLASVCQGFFGRFGLSPSFLFGLSRYLTLFKLGRREMHRCLLNASQSTVSQLFGEHILADRSPSSSFRIFWEWVRELSLVLYIHDVLYLHIEIWLCEVNISVFKLMGFLSIFIDVWFLFTWPSHDTSYCKYKTDRLNKFYVYFLKNENL